MKRIFISYRRKDNGAFTGRIYDQLKNNFGERSVFRDVNNISAGSDFREVLNREINQCEIFLAIIGHQWAGVDGHRLDDPNDFVRIEVELALNNPKILVIPVLVDNANMPAAEDLPQSLREICYRNAVKVRADPDFPHDMQMLLNQLKPTRSILPIQSGLLILFSAMILIAGMLFFPTIKGFFKGTATNGTETSSAYLENGQTLTPAPLFDPVEPGQILVLVAKMEQLGSEERDVTRFIVDDLTNRFEAELPITNIGIREYRQFITSNSDALQVAEQTQAVIVIWGQYDNDSATVNVQLGSLESRPSVVLERDILERAVNIRVKIMDERQETLAYQILSSLILLHCAENDFVKPMSLIIAFDLLDAPSPEPIGNSSAAHVQKAMKAFLSDKPLALNELNQTIELAPDNPLFYMLRGMLYQGMGELALSNQDLDTALLLVPEGWIMPYYIKGVESLILSNLPLGIESYSKVIEQNPDNWFAYNQRGYLYFLAGQYELAHKDIEKSIELKPEKEWPYMLATLVALRQGRMEDASSMMSNLLREQPNPTFIDRLMTAMYGEEKAKLLGESMAAIGHLSLGQYNVVIQDTDGVLAVMPTYTEMYMLRGLSYCNMDNYVDAEAAYTQGLTIDPSFALLNLLRAEMRSKQGNMAGAMEDITAVQQSALSGNLSTYLTAAQSGQFSCKQLLKAK